MTRGKPLGSTTYKCNDFIFSNIDTEESAYWLGYLYCDGCITKAKSGSWIVFLSSIDIDILEKFKKFISSTHIIKKDKNDVNYIRICSFPMGRDLISRGIVERKTYEHSIPISIPIGKLERHFWRGCIEADGSLGFTTRKRVNKKIGPITDKIIFLSLYNRNLFLLNSFQKFIKDRFVAIGSIQQTSSHRGTYFLHRNGTARSMFPLLDTFYKDCTIYMDRKYKIYLNVKEIVENGNIEKSDIPISYNKKTQSLADWAKEIGLDYWTLYRRLYHRNWSIEKTLTSPSKRPYRYGESYKYIQKIAKNDDLLYT